jgi:hypothetical protein
MKQSVVREYLKQARSHVAIGERQIAEHKEVIADLERDGHDSTRARKSLALLDALQKMHVAERARLEKELAEILKMTPVVDAVRDLSTRPETPRLPPSSSSEAGGF